MGSTAKIVYSSRSVKLKIGNEVVAYYSGKHAKTLFEYLKREMPQSWIRSVKANEVVIDKEHVPEIAYVLFMMRRTTKPENLFPIIDALLKDKLPIDVITDELYEAARELDEKVPGIGKKDVLDILGMPYRELARRAAKRFGLKVVRTMHKLDRALSEVETVANVIGLHDVDWHRVVEFLDDIVDITKLSDRDLKAYLLATAIHLYPTTGVLHKVTRKYRQLGLPSWVRTAGTIYYRLYRKR